ncbi:mitochondrial carrier [Hesseltinella vesiculosa]|uniref:Mitochondrial carrier n=1 Tax=Hesseltinella vesiculosa TaxID=101127 RepID=A0A1X2GGX9_9FUNG|nr:mitochondrial carrier [Hesseltinella vesiculosa]
MAVASEQAQKQHPYRDLFASFSIASLAAMSAVTFTNPIEVVKTRLQLQGELVKAGTLSEAARPYHNSFQAMKLIAKNEGFRGLQRGLGVAYIYQMCLNGSRLGLYEPVHKTLIKTFDLQSKKSKIAAGVLSGGFAGVVGAVLGSPLYLIKTRRQSYSPVFKNIGFQHEMGSSWSALRNIYRAEGFKGLYRGVGAAILRAASGSSVQVPSYMFGKEMLMHRFGMPDTLPTHLATSMCSGFLVAIVMNPFDVISTRMYNQGVDPVTGKGVLYSGTFDCLSKSVKAEGFRGLYKGFFAHFLRIGPHTTLMFVFMEQYKGLYQKYIKNL